MTPTDNKLISLLETEGLNESCDGCDFYKEHYQSHAYGSTEATEDVSECECTDDSQCPRLN